jgi:hypothetical protein
MLGIMMLINAMRSIVEFNLPKFELNFCSLCFVPPIRMLNPKTKSKFPIMLPASDALTNSISPLLIAISAIINSAAFPKVALRRPPIWPPMVFANSSVASPILAAKGKIARIEVANNTLLSSNPL